MKPCGNCKYFTRAYTRNLCWAISETESKYNPYSGEVEFWSVAQHNAERMRSRKGLCGPGRRLYKQTFTTTFSIFIYPYFMWLLAIGYTAITLAYIIRHFSA